MSTPGGFRNRSGENRFYISPPMRKEQKQQQQQQQQRQQRKPSQFHKLSKLKSTSSAESEKRIQSDDCASTATTTTTSAFSSPGTSNLTNFDRFIEHTTPLVPAQYFSKSSMKGWRTHDDNFHPYFILGDLWESFKEWSAYGAGVPLLLNGSDSVVQYYVPYLSGIQLYIDPSRPLTKQRRPGEESDAESSRETSSNGSSECGVDIGGACDVQGAWSLQKPMNATTQSFNRLSLRNNLVVGSAIDEGEISNPPGLLIFEYFEHDLPYSREPLADKISVLASQFPELRTYKSCDLTSASWVSVAWYPIYRIPIGPTLQNLDACFLTFHSLSTPFGSASTDWPYVHGSTVKEVHDTGLSLRLSLPIFGLAAYKFKVSDWNPNAVYGCQKVNSLLQAAVNWLRLLHVNHPDFRFFLSHNSYWR